GKSHVRLGGRCACRQIMVVTMNFREAADWYVSLGWKVLPLQPGSKVPFAGSHAVNDATNDPGVIDSWHARAPDSNIAIACGASDLLVLDFDPRNHCM